MLKKMKAEGNDTRNSKDLAQSVLDSSRQIWLAGLGAFSRAQAEGQKVFDKLVQQGEALESRTKQTAMDTASAARTAAAAKAKEVQAIAGGTWDKLEQVFEDRVARALSKLGVHTQSDVKDLSARVDALSDAVNQLIRTSGGTPAPRRPASGAKRAAKGAPKTAPKGVAKRTKAAARMPASGAVGDDAAGTARTPRKATRRKPGAAGTR